MKVTKKSVGLFNAGKYTQMPIRELALIVKVNFPELETGLVLSSVGRDWSEVNELLAKTFKGKKIVWKL